MLPFQMSARGFLIERLQMAMQLKADGIFGPRTREAVLRLQRSLGIPSTGQVGAREWEAIGLPVPGLFERCANLTCVLQGTGFGQANRVDIDGAGVTIGIAGFTTLHGEVQQILREYLARRPSALTVLPQPHRRRTLELLELGSAGNREWSQLCYSIGVLAECWRKAFSTWGRDPVMQQVQLSLAHQRFFQPAVVSGRGLGFRSEQAAMLFYDIAVQNGGWKPKHQRMYDRDPNGRGDEQARLLTAARAVAAGALPQWRQDVLARKAAIAQGSGVVHGLAIRLEDYTFAV